jgi:integrase
MAKLSKMLDAGELVADAKAAVHETESVADFPEAWLARREAQGVVMVKEERAYLKRHILPHLTYALDAVRPVHVRQVIDAAIAGGLRRGTVTHLHRLMGRLFKSAWQDEIIKENPVLRVTVPAVREVNRDRVILTDDEVERFMACVDVDLELRMLSLVSRVEGGMRTGDLLRWDWSYIDLENFKECTIPRAKTERPQVLEIPPVLSPFLRAWWVRQGSPRVGPVFPSRRGKSKGGFKTARGNGFAGRLRRGLLKAGIVRHEVHNDTPTTLRCDFHSFRRAFASALAGAEVSAQHAMKLTGHSDARVHARYVMNTPAMRAIPSHALPHVLALPIKPPKPARADRRPKEPGASLEALSRANSKRSTVNHAAVEVAYELPANTQTRAASGENAMCDPLRSRRSEVRIFCGAPLDQREAAGSPWGQRSAWVQHTRRFTAEPLESA